MRLLSIVGMVACCLLGCTPDGPDGAAGKPGASQTELAGQADLPPAPPKPPASPPPGPPQPPLDVAALIGSIVADEEAPPSLQYDIGRLKFELRNVDLYQQHTTDAPGIRRDCATYIADTLMSRWLPITIGDDE